MRRTWLIAVPFLAFFSKSVYQDAAWRWRGIGMIYLFLLLAVCWAPLGLFLHRECHRFVAEEAGPILDQAPVVTIKKGIASTPENRPYYIVHPKTKDVIFIIDTSGEVTSIKDLKAVGLLTRNALIVRHDAVRTETYEFGQIDGLTIYPAGILRWVRDGEGFVAPTVYGFAVVAEFAYRFVQSLVYAAIGAMFAGWCHSQRSFGSLIRLAVVANTPSILLGTALTATGNAGALPIWVYPLLSLSYLYFGVRAASQESDEEGVFEAQLV